MNDENQVQTEHSQTDLGQILSGGAQAEVESRSAPRQEVTADQQDADGPQDATPKNWAEQAYYKEKKTRQAYKQRVSELEEQNQTLMWELEQSRSVPAEETGTWLDPHAAMAERTIQVNGRASRAEFVSEYGREAFNELERVVEQAMQSGHPDMRVLSERMRASEDPVSVMAQWANEQLGWGAQRPQARPAVYPSNFASARNVGKRSGPAWSGPASISDIFDRARAK